MRQVPNWLDKTAKDYWKKHWTESGLDDSQAETFAMLCQHFSDYRHAPDTRTKKLAIDFYLKFAKELGLITRKQQQTTKSKIGDELDRLINEIGG